MNILRVQKSSNEKFYSLELNGAKKDIKDLKDVSYFIIKNYIREEKIEYNALNAFKYNIGINYLSDLIKIIDKKIKMKKSFSIELKEENMSNMTLENVIMFKYYNLFNYDTIEQENPEYYI